MSSAVATPGSTPAAVADTAAAPSVLRQAIGAQRLPVTLGSALFAAHQALEVAVPVVVGVIIDRAVATGDGGSLTRWIIALAVLFACLSAAGCAGLYVEERAVVGGGHWARLRVAERVLAPGGGVDDALSGQVVSLSTVETARIGEGVGAVMLGVGAITGIVVGATVLILTSATIGLAVVLGVPVVMLVVRMVSEPLVARADAHQEAVGAAAGVAGDLLRGLRVLKGLGSTPAAAAAYRRASRSALAAALDATRLRSAYTGLTFGVAGSFLVVVAWMGGHQALDGDITVGELVAAIGLTQFLLGPLGRLALTGEVLAQARASSERIGAALAAPPAVTGGTRSAERPTGAVVLRGLRHGPLAGLDLEIGAGEVVGIATAAPADAAALIACLDRTADPAGGAVVLDGVDHTALELAQARRAITVAHHDAPLFEEDLAAEVGSAATDPARVGPAVAGAVADEVAAALAEAGDRDLGESGRGLSGGQRQRVALARALATDAAVLVLHEPTTAVDAATEHRIAAGIRAVRGHRTTVLVTTSPTLLASADRVVLVEGGRVVATGDHAGLAATDARYREVVLT
jgi:putative ABC transport system ATP-binding protein